MIKLFPVVLLFVAGCCSPTKGPTAAQSPVSQSPVQSPATQSVSSVSAPVPDPDCPPGEGLVLSKEVLVPTRSAGHDAVKIRKVISTHNQSLVVPVTVETYEVVHCPLGTSVVDFTPKEVSLQLLHETPSYVVQSQVIDVIKLKKIVTTENHTIQVPLRTESFELVK